MSLYDQGLTQVLEAAVKDWPRCSLTCSRWPRSPTAPDRVEPLAAFMTNPAGSAIVNAVGPIRQIVQSMDKVQRRYLVIVPGAIGKLGAPVQVQAE